MDIDPELMQQFEAEMQQLEDGEFPPATVVMPPLVAFALISQIQLASRHPMNNNWYATQSQSVARELQSLFSPDSAVYQILEMGWHPEADFELHMEGRIRQHLKAISQLLVEGGLINSIGEDWEVGADGSDAPI